MWESSWNFFAFHGWEIALQVLLVPTLLNPFFAAVFYEAFRVSLTLWNV